MEFINNTRTMGTTGGWGLSAMATGMTSTLSSMYSMRKESSAARKNASSLYRESMLYSQQAGSLMRVANAYSGVARLQIQMGQDNAKHERVRAGKVQFFIDQNQREAVVEAQQAVGEGLATFAASGVMVEGREGAAVAMWEQDETADAAYQQLLVMQKGQDTIWEYLMAANQREAEGYGQAAGTYGQAADVAGNAYSAYLQSYSARKEADYMRKMKRKAKRGMMGSGIGSVVGAVVAVGAVAFTGGASLAAYATLAGTGMSVGSATGQTAAYW